MATDTKTPAKRTAAKAAAPKGTAAKVPAQGKPADTTPAMAVPTVLRSARTLRFTYKTVTVEEWLNMCEILKDGKVHATAFPEAGYQRGRIAFTDGKKKQQLVHIGGGGVFPPLTVWMPDGKLSEVINGQQRTHSFAMWAQALHAKMMDSEALVSGVIETAIAALDEEGVTPITWDELKSMPVTLEILPDDATYEQREELFLKRGTTEIPIKTEHMADLAQKSLVDLISKWGIKVKTAKEIANASNGMRGKGAAKVDGFKSIIVIEAVHAYVNGNPEVSKAKMAAREDNAKIMAKLSGSEEESGKNLAVLFNEILPELHAKCDDYWGALKKENSTVLSALAAAWGYAVSATTPSKVRANVKLLRQVLTGAGNDPLDIAATSQSMLSFYDLPSNAGKKKRDLMFHGFAAFFESGPAVTDGEGTVTAPIRWDLAAKKAGIEV